MAALAAGLAMLASGCGNDRASTPHDKFPAVIPVGKVFPEGGEVVLTSSGRAIYQPDPGEQNPGITKIEVLCVPGGKSGFEFVYTKSSTYTIQLTDFEPCADGRVTTDELSQLQTIQ